MIPNAIRFYINPVCKNTIWFLFTFSGVFVVGFCCQFPCSVHFFSPKMHRWEIPDSRPRIRVLDWVPGSVGHKIRFSPGRRFQKQNQIPPPAWIGKRYLDLHMFETVYFTFFSTCYPSPAPHFRHKKICWSEIVV